MVVRKLKRKTVDGRKYVLTEHPCDPSCMVRGYYGIERNLWSDTSWELIKSFDLDHYAEAVEFFKSIKPINFVSESKIKVIYVQQSGDLIGYGETPKECVDAMAREFVRVCGSFKQNGYKSKKDWQIKTQTLEENCDKIELNTAFYM